MQFYFLPWKPPGRNLMKPQNITATSASRSRAFGGRAWRLSALVATAMVGLSYPSGPTRAAYPGLSAPVSGNLERVADRGKKDKDTDTDEKPMQAAWCTMNSMRQIPFETEILVVPPGTTLQHLFPIIKSAMQQKYLTAAVPPVKCEFAKTEPELRSLQKKRAIWEMTTVRQTGLIRVIDPNDFPGRPYQFIKPEKNPTLGQESAPKALGVAQGLDPRGFGEPRLWATGNRPVSQLALKKRPHRAPTIAKPRARSPRLSSFSDRSSRRACPGHVPQLPVRRRPAAWRECSPICAGVRPRPARATPRSIPPASGGGTAASSPPRSP